jgi:hypothetical protein
MHELFTAPYKPTLINISNQKVEMLRLSKIRHSKDISKPAAKTYKSYTENPKKSSFPIYNEKTVSTFTNNNYEINNNNNTINFASYPLKREIIIRNPEEIIESGILKSSIRKEGFPSIYEEPKFNPFTGIHISQEPNNNNVVEPIKIIENVEDKVKDIEEPNQQNLNKNISQNIEPNNEINQIIPGKLTETVKLDDNELEEMENEESAQPEENNEIPVAETIATKKYIIKSGNIVSLPENYSTDDEDEMIAINTLNEDISSWKKYTDKDGIKLYFKPYPVKDEEGKDVESVIGYCEAILDFPASKVISIMNDFEFRRNYDDQYKKGNLISERIEGNIKYMEMYLFLKMPFIFSDRDFVVRKKCWLDYNGNKDHALFYLHSIENPEYPPKKKLVRGNYANRSGYIKPLGDNQCQLNTVTAMDVKMSLGVSTMSKNGAEMQEKWIKNLRKELAK